VPTTTSHSNADFDQDEIEDEVLALDSLQFYDATSTSTLQPNNGAIDRAGWGRSLLGPGLDRWMDKGIRSWWMVNKDNSIVKKGLKMGQSLLRAVNDQG
jgi:hypothetical protein